jgi:hypothetical protein
VLVKVRNVGQIEPIVAVSDVLTECDVTGIRYGPHRLNQEAEAQLRGNDNAEDVVGVVRSAEQVEASTLLRPCPESVWV